MVVKTSPFRLTTILIPLILFACDASTPKKPPPPPPPPAPEPVIEVPQEPVLSPREHNILALELFHEGDYDGAKHHLRQSLAQQPGNPTARKLLRQFEVDPVAYLGKDAFEYRVKAGESLSLLADRFLGDGLEFIVLARYNRVARPALLRAGQTLRIPRRKTTPPKEKDPGEKPSPASVTGSQSGETPKPPATVPEATTEIRAEPMPEPAAETTEPAPGPAAEMAEPAPGPAAEMTEPAPGPAVEMAEPAPVPAAETTEPTPEPDAEIAEPVPEPVTESAEPAPPGATHYQAGLKQKEAGELEQALNNFEQAIAREPGNTLYEQARDETRTALVDHHHRKALEHYRREQLEPAKSHWRKVLEFDPDNRIAPGYLSKAEEIQRRLRELEAQ